MLHGQKLAMTAEAPFAVVTALPEEQVFIARGRAHDLAFYALIIIRPSGAITS